MHLKRFTIQNYKSFNGPTSLDLAAHLSLIAGKNNAGKSSLLQSIRGDISPRAHRSKSNVPTRGLYVGEHFVSTYELQFSGADVLQYISTQTEMNIPVPGFQRDADTDLNLFLTKLVPQQTNDITLRLESVPRGKPAWMLVKVTGFDEFMSASGETNAGHKYMRNFRRTAKSVWFGSGNSQQPEMEMVMARMAKDFITDALLLHAERLAVNSAAAFGDFKLLPDCSNLGTVIFNIPDKLGVTGMMEFNKKVNSIIPSVVEVSAAPDRNGRVNIRLWPLPSSEGRDDLTIPLQESGSGVAQVLSLVCLLVSAQEPRLVIIDEPNTFLHPLAARALIDMISDYEQHQFIISTHSPVVVSSALKKSTHVTVSMLHLEEGVTTVKQLDMEASDEARLLLEEVGSRASDLLIADNVVWVEGKTEERCFQTILKSIRNRGPSELSFRAIVNTGDFDSRDPEKVFEIYNRLSTLGGVWPVGLKFIFDRELRSQDQRNRVSSGHNGKIVFLPRRMFENYLLEIDTVIEVMKDVLNPLLVTVDEGQARRLFSDSSNKFELTPTGLKGDSWKEGVHGARLLEDIFSAASDGKLVYDKVRHSRMLVEKLIQKGSEDLKELAGWLNEQLSPLLDSKGDSTEGESEPKGGSER